MQKNGKGEEGGNREGEGERREKREHDGAEHEDKASNVYKFAVEFAFPSSSNFRSRPAFLYDRRISNLREISGATLFQRFRGFPGPGFQWPRAAAVNFSPLPSSSPPPPPPFAFLSTKARTFTIRFRFTATRRASGAFHYLRKHVTSARRIRRDSARLSASEISPQHPSLVFSVPSILKQRKKEKRKKKKKKKIRISFRFWEKRKRSLINHSCFS